MITKLSEKDRKKLKEAVVGIAGCGGLGSNCAMALARAGVGHLIIMDHDKVEESNLNRQAYTADQIGWGKVRCLRNNILAAAPGTKVTMVERYYEKGEAAEIFEGCEVVVEAFDDPGSKTALIEDVMANMEHAFIVGASGIAGIGGNEGIETRRYGRLYLVGDGRTPAEPGVALLAPRVTAVAALQAYQALALLLGDAGLE